MKILMMTPYIGTIYGGIPKVVKELAESLGQQQFSIDLITTNANGSETIDVPLNTWIKKEGYRIRYFDSWFCNDLIFSYSLLRWLWKHSSEYDLLHSHTLFSPLNSLVHYICRYRRLPYVMTPHGMLEPWALAYKSRKKKVFYNLIERNSLKAASAIHALTSVEVDQICNLGIDSAVHVHNGIHRKQFDNLPSSQLFYDSFPALKGRSLILFLGRIDPKKGLDLLAQAYTKVAAAYPDAHLVIAGPDSINFLPAVKRYFEQVDCSDRVTFTGMLTGNLKLSALAAAQVYVAPSYSEGFSMSVLEGMASALPCVFTTGCNFPEAAQANVACEVAVDADDIAAALLRCFENPTYANSMGERAQQFVFCQYTWESVSKRLVEVYRSILNKSSPATFSVASAVVPSITKV